jgi:protein-L-isoaspartate O-methyltransferase
MSHASNDRCVTDRRHWLRTTFESAAGIYEEARPDYPDSLYATLVQAAGLRVGDRLLEIGCATGKATIALARHGFQITCVEIGSALAAGARSNLTTSRRSRSSRALLRPGGHGVPNGSISSSLHCLALA